MATVWDVNPWPKLVPVVDPEDITLYHELGLGRGVNVTDPDMWKSKTPYLVRVANCLGIENSNIIGTQECGILESYKTEVSTFEMQKQKLWLSLDNLGASQVKIGLDEQSSRSISSSKLIEGKKIETRTISFRFHFDDVPLYDDIEQAVLETPPHFLQDCDDNKFEEDLATWFLKRINDREQKFSDVNESLLDGQSQTQEPNAEESLPEEEQNDETESSNEGTISDDDSTETLAIEKLAEKLIELSNTGHDWTKDISKDCEVFLNYLGITHYVSAIKLGACEYSVVTSRIEENRLGASTTTAAGSLGKGGLSALIEKQFTKRFMGEEKKKIGRIDSTKEEVTKEAVIGFEIQPIYKLVRIQFIQMALRKAIKEYIISKDNKGPYLISTEIDETPVFWKVEKKSGRNYQLKGTESTEEASLFFIIPVGDPVSPADFHIAYWDKKRGRQYQMHVDDLYRTHNPHGPPLPHYLSTDTNIVGISKGSLSLKNSIKIRRAQFSLHSRVQSSFACMTCTSSPVDLSSWLDGEQFYIKCSYHSLFKVDGFIAAELENADLNKTVERATIASNTYKITTVLLPIGKDPTRTGLLFRLHPKVINKPKDLEVDSTIPEGASASNSVDGAVES